MVASQEAAEAISEGVNRLAWLVTDPGEEQIAQSAVDAAEELSAMASAIEATQKGDVWSSRSFEPELLKELEQVQDELRAGGISKAGQAAAKRILQSLGLSGDVEI